MAKFMKKSELTYNKNGYIVDAEGNVLNLSPSLVIQLEELDTKVQRAMYFLDQPKAVPVPSMEGFVRESIRDNVEVKPHANLPMLEAKIEEGKQLALELDLKHYIDGVDRFLSEECREIIGFVLQDEVLVSGHDSDFVRQIDAPYIGNPLELDLDTLIKAAHMVVAHRYDCKELMKYVDSYAVPGDIATEELAAAADNNDRERFLAELKRIADEMADNENGKVEEDKEA